MIGRSRNRTVSSVAFRLRSPSSPRFKALKLFIRDRGAPVSSALLCDALLARQRQ